MKNKLINPKDDLIKNRIFTTRGIQVMLDSDLAEMYGVETKTLNRAVMRNIERFPERFMFQLTVSEFNSLRSQNVTLEKTDPLRYQNGTLENTNLKYQIGTSSFEHGGRRKLPYVFTEQGVAMLSGVLKSETAIKVSLQIMD